MLRSLAALSLALAAPLAAQVTVIPPTGQTVVVPRVDPLWVRDVAQSAMDRAQSYVDQAQSWQDFSYNFNFDQLNSLTGTLAYSDAFGAFSGPRAPWAKADPADSLYRSARDLLNRGDYRRSAALFKELPQKFPTSAYVNDAMYWQAFALYRIGGTPELQEALTVLEALKAKTPPADAAAKNRNRTVDDAQRSRDRSPMSLGKVNPPNPIDTRINTTLSGDIRSYVVDNLNSSVWFGAGSGQNDAVQLAARIAKVLSDRGLANDAAVKRALAAAGNSCDSEDQQVRSEALSALMGSDPEMARQSAVRMLARKDECSVPLRRTALTMIASRQDEATAAILIPVAKSDPSAEVRTTATNLLARMPGDAALNALEELATSSDDNRVQRSALRALASSPNARARSGLRALIEKNDAPEGLRLTALESYGRESSPDDIAWLRGTYAKVTSPRIKSSIVDAVARIGGDANDAWLSSLVRNEDEPMEARMSALHAAGRSMDIAALAKLYDAASQRQVRSEVIDLLASRKEPAAVDKLIEIARSGTDPGMRRSAISALARSKDPRAQKLLLDLVDHQ